MGTFQPRRACIRLPPSRCRRLAGARRPGATTRHGRPSRLLTRTTLRALPTTTAAATQTSVTATVMGTRRSSFRRGRLCRPVRGAACLVGLGRQADGPAARVDMKTTMTAAAAAAAAVAGACAVRIVRPNGPARVMNRRHPRGWPRGCGERRHRRRHHPLHHLRNGGVSGRPSDTSKRRAPILGSRRARTTGVRRVVAYHHPLPLPKAAATAGARASRTMTMEPRQGSWQLLHRLSRALPPTWMRMAVTRR